MYQFLVQNLVVTYGVQHIFKHLKHRRPTVYDAILQYNQLDKEIPFAEKLYRYVHEIRKPPFCLYCGKRVKKFYGYNRGYAFFCSRKCMAQSKITKVRREDTLKNRYGVDSPVEVRWDPNRTND